MPDMACLISIVGPAFVLGACSARPVATDMFMGNAELGRARRIYLCTKPLRGKFASAASEVLQSLRAPRRAPASLKVLAWACLPRRLTSSAYCRIL